MQNKKINTKKIVGIAMLTAIVVLFQFLGTFIRFGTFAVSPVLLPIVIGAALYGYGAGAWLGFMFGITVLLSGDASLFLNINITGTILTVLLKGILAGLVACLLYRCFCNKNRYIGVVAAALICPVVNTGTFLIGCRLFFMDFINENATIAGQNVFLYMIIGLVGANFIFELLLNVILSPIAYRLLNIKKLS